MPLGLGHGSIKGRMILVSFRNCKTLLREPLDNLIELDLRRAKSPIDFCRRHRFAVRRRIVLPCFALKLFELTPVDDLVKKFQLQNLLARRRRGIFGIFLEH